MQTVEITRAGNLSVGRHPAEMPRGLVNAGIRVTGLYALRILRGRVTFTITFHEAADADCFLRVFSAVALNKDSPARLPPRQAKGSIRQ